MKRAVDALTDGTFDLVVLGGGITGSGVALDAASRGLRVALLDKADFASGTSSASSKLVHGGLRYLEQLRFRLVYEALYERSLLLHNAPHSVRPLRFLLPFYEGARLPIWKGRLGLALYDLLAGRHNIHRSRSVPKDNLLIDCPGLRRTDLCAGAEFYDAQMDDARVVIEVLQTAASHGAILANYVEATSFALTQGGISGVHILDRIQEKEILVRARQVLNATGPWLDAVCRMAGDAGGPRLQPTKGAHVILPGRGLSAALLLLHPRDGRVFFVIPWLGKTLIGTTDTFSAAGPEAQAVDAADIAYLLEGHNHYFQSAVQPSEVMGSFVGLRPLIRARAGEPSALSREFRLIASPSGLLSAAGGKFTTYRAMAEKITDEVVRRLGRKRRCRTRELPLDGAPREPWGPFLTETMFLLCKRYLLSPTTAEHLVRRYGRRAETVANYLEQQPQLAQPMHPSEPEIMAELAYQKDHEMALLPADHWLRRTRLGLYRPELLSRRPDFNPVVAAKTD